MVLAETETREYLFPINADRSRESLKVVRPDIHLATDRDDALRKAKTGIHYITKIREIDRHVIFPKEYEFNHSPKQHTDEDGNVISGALYFIEKHIDGGVIFLSYLPPGQITSSTHRHSKDMYENYHLLYGEAEMILGYDQKQFNLPLADYVRIPFGMGHRMRAGSKGALTLIYLENPHNLPPEKIHLRD